MTRSSVPWRRGFYIMPHVLCDGFVPPAKRGMLKGQAAVPEQEMALDSHSNSHNRRGGLDSTCYK